MLRTSEGICEKVPANDAVWVWAHGGTFGSPEEWTPTALQSHDTRDWYLRTCDTPEEGGFPALCIRLLHYQSAAYEGEPTRQWMGTPAIYALI
jgi:hypothetical protein